MLRTLFEDQHVVRQRGLDSSIGLQVARQRTLSCIDERGRSTRSDVEVLAVGIVKVRKALVDWGTRWREVLAVNAPTSLESLGCSFDADQRYLARGVHMTDLVDLESCQTEAGTFVARRAPASYSFVMAPVQMKIIDRRQVVVEGPLIDGERTVVVSSSTDMLGVAWHYWSVVSRSAVPVRALAPVDPLRWLTPRQREIAHLLADDLSDEAIALRLQVCVRTVRYEVAAIMRLLDTRSRFGAGFRLGRIGFEHLARGDRTSPSLESDARAH